MNFVGLKEENPVFKMAMPDTINTIEWDMMDKRKFFPLSMLSSFTVRCCLYPLTVIKTRLQVQRHDQMYKGKFNCFAYFVLYRGLHADCGHI